MHGPMSCSRTEPELRFKKNNEILDTYFLEGPKVPLGRPKRAAFISERVPGTLRRHWKGCRLQGTSFLASC